ncbi:MAG: tetratricopeptide repeat protein [Microcoleus sp. SIO2G3]|nr:tetratricopeptide repeat protein [Microcoleus sp. SIO2G3]
MHRRLKSLSLTTATLLLSLFTPLLPLTLNLKPLVVQAQTIEEQEPGAEKWFLEAYELWLKGDYPATLEKLQQDLARFRQEGDRARVGAVIACIGIVYRSMGQYPQALEYSQNALALLREVGKLPNDDRSTARTWEGRTLNNIGIVYSGLGQYAQALEYSQQALAIHREVGDRLWEGRTLNSMGGIYSDLGQYPKALQFYQQALAIFKEVGNRSEQGIALGSIGVVYWNLGQYPKALEFYQQALAIFTKIGDHAGEGAALNAIGLIYSDLGQYPKALEFHQQALAIRRRIGSKAGEGTSLSNIGSVYLYLEQYPKALEFYQQALGIQREIGNKSYQGTILNNIGQVYNDLGQYPKALEFYQQALAISREIGNRAGEGTNLTNIGSVHLYLRQYPKALEFYQQALAIQREIGDKATEGTTLNNIGFLLEAQNQPELAIIFYKQSVNVTEAIRKDLRVLPKEQQQSFTETVTARYRRLADLLLKQDRVLEAQRVLDLLKIQELEDYLSNVRGNNNTTQGLPNLPPEQQTWDSYQTILDKAVEIGKELTQLRQLKQNATLTPAQEQRIAQLVKAQETIREDFNNFTRSPEVLALVTQRSPETLSQDLLLQMGNFNALQDNLENLQQKAVLLYPLILDDRIELILTTPDSPPIRRTVPVPKQQLNETIAAFRSALFDRTSDAKAPAQQLYNWLIKPLEAELKAADAQTIIYAPDAQLRYIPLAALYDGQQWLVQRYRINNITAASLTDLNTQPQRQMQILAGAFATGRYSFKVGEQSFDFSGLPFAGAEVENLAKTVPSTTKFIDSAFTPQVTVPKMDDYTVVHLATHAAFVVGTPDDSFILFGNGDRITLRDIQTWSLKNVDLVILSACETGIGGKLGNGEEILGLGYQMQRAGARAAIASLWSVSDGGTQALMNAFYAGLKNGSLTKAEALRQAQIALITNNSQALGEQRGVGVEAVGDRTQPSVQAQLSHPYYWAPFILIGNGL